MQTDNCQLIRQTIRLKRRQLSPHSRHQASLELDHYIGNTAWFHRSQRIAFYQAVSGEVDPVYLMHRAWRMHKTCYLPVCHPINKQSLLFVPYFQNDPLTPNRYHILEPDLKTRSPVKSFSLDLVFVPLVAFDDAGNRLGSGKGYYDRTFAYLRRSRYPTRPLLVGLAYGFQAVEKLSPQDWDVPMDKIVIVNSYE